MFSAFRETLRRLRAGLGRNPDGRPTDDRIFKASGQWYVQMYRSTVLGPYSTMADAEALVHLVDCHFPGNDAATNSTTH